MNRVCHGTRKIGNLVVHFSRQGKHREFAKNIKICFTQVIYHLQCYENFLSFITYITFHTSVIFKCNGQDGCRVCYGEGHLQTKIFDLVVVKKTQGKC